VYSGLLWIERTSHPCAVSIGTNPTFDGVVDRRVEAHVIGRDDLDLYGHRVDLDFLGHVRPMVKFDGIEALLRAMAQDVADAREHISHYVTGLGGDFANDTVRW
jgi:riboflavin kinase/FMN adenylyltransferase